MDGLFLLAANQVPESDFPKLFVAFLKRFRAKAMDGYVWVDFAEVWCP